MASTTGVKWTKLWRIRVSEFTVSVFCSELNQVTTMVASCAKLKKMNAANSEETSGHPYRMEPDVSHLTSIRSYFDRFCKMPKLSDHRKKSCEDIVLGLVTVITLCINVLPFVLFITIQVSTIPFQ